MIKVLVAVADYPDMSGGVAMMFVHVRSKYYIQHDIDVTVLNFKAETNYEIDGIKVISLESYELGNATFDVLVSHAANLRNHYRFLKKYEKRFPHLVFFFHGHEVVKINEVYPEPYNYMKKGGFLKKMLHGVYDNLKLFVWHHYFPQIAHKSDFVFVSNCLFREARKYLRLSENDFAGHVHIINNSVGKAFEEKSYSHEGEKQYDFITIRGNLDSSTYCIDLVCGLAANNPTYNFLVIGRGQYFDFRRKPENVTWINQTLSHEKMLDVIGSSRCALMPTRRDTQGVMSCELVSYGIPLITSDLPVCHEMFKDMDNVELISNNLDIVNLPVAYDRLLNKASVSKSSKFDYVNTVLKEENILRKRV